MIKIISVDVVDNFNSSDRDLLLEKCKKLEMDKDSMLNDCTEFYNRVCEYKKEVKKLNDTISLLKIENNKLKDILVEKDKNINELNENTRDNKEIEYLKKRVEFLENDIKSHHKSMGVIWDILEKLGKHIDELKGYSKND